mmetsp:Transcript_32064/g.47693  ORF Transcript_32064/g.47693 Transcript_32064/m.47693 type:complete len:201 (+) Transcript_32064:576-1178(+)
MDKKRRKVYMDGVRGSAVAPFDENNLGLLLSITQFAMNVDELVPIPTTAKGHTHQSEITPTRGSFQFFEFFVRETSTHRSDVLHAGFRVSLILLPGFSCFLLLLMFVQWSVGATSHCIDIPIASGFGHTASIRDVLLRNLDAVAVGLIYDRFDLDLAAIKFVTVKAIDGGLLFFGVEEGNKRILQRIHVDLASDTSRDRT